MLARFKNDQITGDDLAALADVLAIKSFKDGRSDVRARWLAAQAATAKARQAHEEAVKLHWHERDDQPDVRAALGVVERCLRDEAAAREAVGRAADSTEAAYLEMANKQIDRALPVIEEITALVADVLTPLEDMYLFGSRKRLPQPRLIDELVRLGPVWRFFVAAVNRRRSAIG